MPTTRQPLSLAIWADRRADRPGGGGDHDGLAGLRLADVEQADVGGQPGHAERRQRQRRLRHRGIKLAQAAAIGQQPVLPAGVGDHAIADGEIRVLRRGDLRDRLADHQAADRHRCGIAGVGVHAAAHVRIERQVFGLQQQLAGTGLGNRQPFDAEVLQAGLADRPFSEHQATVDRAGGLRGLGAGCGIGQGFGGRL